MGDSHAEELGVHLAPHRSGAGKGLMAGPVTSSSESHPRRIVRGRVSVSVEEESISGNVGDEEIEEWESSNDDEITGEDNLGVPFFGSSSDSDDREYAVRDGIFEESQDIKPRLTSSASHSHELKKLFVFNYDDEEENETSIILPDINDRAHHHRKGLCLYWILPYCGLQLPLTKFERTLLRLVDLAPCQLTPPTWCHITSFQQLFEQIPTLKEYKPSVPVFCAFYALYFTSSEHLAWIR